ncbi:MAG TPA: hypothetical protein ENK19_07230 [Acidobacteria bacterium]|nr:hypothetical protein [Acidobacteriota bacterium]
MADRGILVVHGDGLGRFDATNVFTWLDREGHSSCELFLKKPVHPSVAKLLDEDGRVTARTAVDPARAARERLAELEAQGTPCRLERLEIVSDRSFTRCPC